MNHKPFRIFPRLMTEGVKQEACRFEELGRENKVDAAKWNASDHAHKGLMHNWRIQRNRRRTQHTGRFVPR